MLRLLLFLRLCYKASRFLNHNSELDHLSLKVEFKLGSIHVKQGGTLRQVSSGCLFVAKLGSLFDPGHSVNLRVTEVHHLLQANAYSFSIFILEEFGPDLSKKQDGLEVSALFHGFDHPVRPPAFVDAFFWTAASSVPNSHLGQFPRHVGFVIRRNLMTFELSIYD